MDGCVDMHSITKPFLLTKTNVRYRMTLIFLHGVGDNGKHWKKRFADDCEEHLRKFKVIREVLLCYTCT